MKAEHIEILIKHRLQQAADAIKDARILINNQGTAQSIINRSYYAMFYAVLSLLQQLGSVPSKHTGVISIFDREFILKGIFPKELSKSLHKAFDLRQTSDYKVIKPISIEKAKLIFDEAVLFVNTVSAYLLNKDDQERDA